MTHLMKATIHEKPLSRNGSLCARGLRPEFIAFGVLLLAGALPVVIPQGSSRGEPAGSAGEGVSRAPYTRIMEEAEDTGEGRRVADRALRALPRVVVTAGPSDLIETTGSAVPAPEEVRPIPLVPTAPIVPLESVSGVAD